MDFLRTLDRSTVWLWLVLATAAVFPWHERLSAVGIVLLVLHWLWDRDLVYKITRFRPNPVALLSWAFFFWHLLGLTWSGHRAEGWQSVEVKLSLLLLPLLFSTENHLHGDRRLWLERVFIYSCLLSFLFCMAHSFLTHPGAPLSVVFFRMNISAALMHPGYYSNYLLFALILLALQMMRARPRIAWPDMLSGALLLFALFILLSKTALFCLGVFLLYIGWKVTARLNPLPLRIGLFAGTFLILLLLAFRLPPLASRLQETLGETAAVQPAHLLIGNSTGSRLAAWSLEWDLITRKPWLGYGTGSANPELLNALQREGYTNLVIHGMHTHQQFLHTWLDLGLPGLLLLTAWLSVLLLSMLGRHGDETGRWLFLLLAINLLTDDMLEIQAGMVFFTFFLMLIIYRNAGYVKRRRYAY